MSYIYYKYPIDIKFNNGNRTRQDKLLEILDWLWRNIGCSKTGHYEQFYMRKWKRVYYNGEDWYNEANGVKDVWIPVGNWTTRNCNFGKIRFYFKNAEDAMAFKLRWL